MAVHALTPPRGVRVLLMATGVNSLTQRIWVDLADLGYQVSVSTVADQGQMRAAVEQVHPDLVIAPYLKRSIPESIWSACPCLVVHPGVPGDRGPSSLDWAIRDGEDDWGVTVLQANAEFDAGDIWAHRGFKMRPVTKSALYRHEIADAASQAVQEALIHYRRDTFVPAALDYGSRDVRGRVRPAMKQRDRALDWSAPTEQLMRRLRCSDSSPGVADMVDGERYYLFGPHEDDSLHGPAGALLGWRHGAMCRATGDGAIWIERLKRVEPASLKLPAEKVLGWRHEDLPVLDVPQDEDGAGRTWRDIRYREKGDVGYLHFDFYNGAMSTTQCRRLRQAYQSARRRPTKAIVLMGGDDLWSNGIDLAAIEAAHDPAQESWRNLNAIDDLVRDIVTTDSHLTCAALSGNAGAGGVILALAADLVCARDGVVLNPHYQTMHLFGSEYWTYLLPRRVGTTQARDLTEACRPISTRAGERMGLIDHILTGPLDAFHYAVRAQVEALTTASDYDRRLYHKRALRQRDEDRKPLQAYRDEELARMRHDFAQPAYHQSRRRFLYGPAAPARSAAGVR